MIIAIPLTTLLLSYYKEFIVSAERIHAMGSAQQEFHFDDDKP